MSKTKVFPFKKQENSRVPAVKETVIKRDATGRITPESLVGRVREILSMNQVIRGHKEIDAEYYEDLIHAVAVLPGIGEIIWNLYAYYTEFADHSLEQGQKLDLLIGTVNESPEACLMILKLLAEAEQQADEAAVAGKWEEKVQERLEKAGLVTKKELAN